MRKKNLHGLHVMVVKKNDERTKADAKWKEFNQLINPYCFALMVRLFLLISPIREAALKFQLHR